MRSFRPSTSTWLTLLLLASATTSPAADREEIRSRLLTARQKFAQMQDMKTVYFAKKELAGEVQMRVDYRREVEANVRMLKITVDGFPARRTNFQQEVYNNWLAARYELTEVDRQIEFIRSKMRDIDEMILAQAEASGKRPGPANRRDILVVYPEVERQCGDAFDALRMTVSAATQDPEEAGRMLQEANAELNRSGDGDDRLGPSGPFFSALRQYKRPAAVAQPKKKARAAAKK